MPAVVMTKVMATATIINGAICRKNVEQVRFGQKRVGDKRKDDAMTKKKRRC